jgi:quercetin dioxygenase-like cupin family protein
MMIDRRSMLMSTPGNDMGLFPSGQAVSAQGDPPWIPGFSASGEATRLWVGGVVVAVRADSQMTGGGYSLIEDLVAPRLGAPLHVHSREDEAIYVTAGELEVTVAEARRLAKPGDVVHMPRGIPHGFLNASDRPARMLIVFSPGGFERAFLEIGKPVGSEETPPTLTPQDMQRMRGVAERYGAKWV